MDDSIPTLPEWRPVHEGGLAHDSLTRRLDASAGFQLLVRAITDALLILDAEEKVVYVGDGSEEVLGTPAACLLGRSIRDLVHADDRRGLPPRIEEDGGPWEVRFQGNGAHRWTSLAATNAAGLSHPGANGDILEHLEGHVLLFARDIGDERVSRDRLDLFRRALDATNNLVVVSDAAQDDLPIVFVNQHFLDVTGYEREEVIGRNCRFLQVRPDGTRDDHQDGIRQLRRCIEDEEAVHVLLRNYTKRGERFWNDLFITPIRNAAGAVTHYVGVQNDVTDRVEAASHHAERAELAAAVEQAADAVVVTSGGLDRPGPTIRYVNEAFVQMTGYDRDEVVGRSPRFMQGPMTDRAALDRLRRQLERGLPYHGELVNQKKDGTPYVVEIDIMPMRNDRGEVVRFVSTQRDVTERRRLEAEVLGATSRAQAEIARDLHDGVGQVLAGTAFLLHGLAGDLEDDRSAYAEQASRAADLVRQAQRQARTLAHGLFPAAVTGDGLAAELARLAEETAATYDVDCRFVCDAPFAARPDDRAVDLYRIAQEAIGNAIRHGQARTVTVCLDPPREGTEPSDGLAALVIEDDGVGMPDSEAQGGSGIGVNTMRYRARRIGGSLEIVPRAGGGTAVQIRFPLYADAVLPSLRKEA